MTESKHKCTMICRFLIAESIVFRLVFMTMLKIRLKLNEPPTAEVAAAAAAAVTTAAAPSI